MARATTPYLHNFVFKFLSQPCCECGDAGGHVVVNLRFVHPIITSNRASGTHTVPRAHTPCLGHTRRASGTTHTVPRVHTLRLGYTHCASGTHTVPRAHPVPRAHGPCTTTKSLSRPQSHFQKKTCFVCWSFKSWQHSISNHGRYQLVTAHSCELYSAASLRLGDQATSIMI